MKNILLLGDSIMYGAKGIHGYGFYIQHNMSDVANVHFPLDNCQDVRYLLTCFDGLVDEKDDIFDLIHWNNGLWDVLHFAGNPNPHTPLDVYSDTIDKVFLLLKNRYPSAKICFATTTAIPEHLQKTSSYRKNSEIELFNQTALRTLDGKIDFVDDLYPYSLKVGDEYRAPDGLHYSEKGSKLMANQVEKCIRDILTKL